MALETGNFIYDLDAANPAAADPKSQGDDHLRLIKAVLLQSFAGFSGAVVVCGTDGGAADAYTVTPDVVLPALVEPMMVLFSPVADNIGAATINISGLGAVALKGVDGDPLISGELQAGSYYLAVLNATEFRLLGPSKQYVDQLAFNTVLPNQAGKAGFHLTSDGTTAQWENLFAKFVALSVAL